MRAGSLAIVAVGVLVGAPEFAAAQRLPPLPPPPVSLTVPRPIPPISTSPTPPKDLFQQLTPPEPIPPRVMHPRGFFYGPSVLYGPSLYYLPSAYGYGYGYGYMPSVETERLPIAARLVPRGWLRFETTPGSAQVSVDGYYVGLVDDFGLAGHTLELEAGPHRIEVRESGYATLAFEVNIIANATMRYRGDLQRVDTPQPPAIASTPKTTYVIPNCYAGDRPPTRPLPSGCDIKQLQTRN